MQERLRQELTEEFPNSDPTWEQLTNGAGLHYLDAVVHEILRIHTPLNVTRHVVCRTLGLSHIDVGIDHVHPTGR